MVLISGDGHNAWLNSVALARLRLPARDGVVEEVEWFQAYTTSTRVIGDDGTSPDAYLQTLQDAATKGIAGLVDLEFDQRSNAWPEREAAGAELLRVRVGAYIDTLPSSWLPACAPATRCPAAARWSRWAR